MGAKMLGNHRVQHIAVHDAGECLSPNLVGERLGAAHPLPHGEPLAGAQYHHGDEAIGRLEQRVHHGGARTDDRRVQARVQGGLHVGQLPGVEVDGRFQHREVQVLAPSGALFGHQPDNRGQRADQASGVVGEGPGNEQRRLLRDARSGQVPAHGLDNLVGGLELGIRPLLAEIGDRQHQEVLELAGNLPGVQPERGQRPRLGRLDPHVGAGQQFPQLGLALSSRYVDGDAPLVEVAEGEIQAGFAVGGVRGHAPGCGPARRLHPDDIGTEVGQQPSGQFAFDIGHVDDPEAAQRQFIRRHGP